MTAYAEHEWASPRPWDVGMEGQATKSVQTPLKDSLVAAYPRVTQILQKIPNRTWVLEHHGRSVIVPSLFAIHEPRYAVTSSHCSIRTPRTLFAYFSTFSFISCCGASLCSSHAAPTLAPTIVKLCCTLKWSRCTHVKACSMQLQL